MRVIATRREPQPASTNQEHLRVEQSQLARFADLWDEQMAAVTLALGVVECARKIERMTVLLPVGKPSCERDDVHVAEFVKGLCGEC